MLMRSLFYADSNKIMRKSRIRKQRDSIEQGSATCGSAATSRSLDDSQMSFG